ncbi:MAG: cytochrome c [Gemmatimonadaceae bacterium]|nr:cytochrome c [Gemmatimonadaceae bacterium]
MPLRLLALLPLGVATAIAATQQAPRTTADGVYTPQQADAGKDLWVMRCQSCHQPHNGPNFKAKWMGRDLGQLFEYTMNEMPKSDPGSLSEDEVASAIAFLMRANGMPAGATALPADQAALARIRFDSVRSAPTSTGPRR